MPLKIFPYGLSNNRIMCCYMRVTLRVETLNIGDLRRRANTNDKNKEREN